MTVGTGMIKTRIRQAVSALAATVMAGVLGAGGAMAGMGQPSPGQINMQEAATEVAQSITWFHDFVTVIIVAIAVFVLLLMAFVVFRFNERANPQPSRVSHNTMLEVVWTVLPILILVVIAIPSFKLLYLQYTYPKPDVTVKVIGNAWFWEHEFPDQGGFKVTSNMVSDEDLLKQELGSVEFEKRFGKLDGLERIKATHDGASALWAKNNMVRQLSVDNEIAVPVNKVVHMLVTSNDVIHSWTIPSFGSKVQAVPGRITGTWFRPTKTGMFYGQCSVLCGKAHSSMPIAIRVVNEKAFADWTDALKQAAAERDSGKRRDLINRAKQVLKTAEIEDRAAAIKVAEGAGASRSN